MKKRSLTRRVATMATVAAMAAVPTLALTSAVGPADAAANDQTVSGVATPMWQTNNNVEAIAVANGIVYAGGSFTSVRPPNVAAGTSDTPRTYLAAFNASTGALVTGFNVALNGPINDLAVSPDRTKLYIAGTFTTVNGVTKQRVAAINIPSGTLNTGFTANAGSGTTAIAATANAVYVSGDWLRLNGITKTRLAAVNPTTGALLPGFTGSLDLRANAITVAPDNSRLLVGGNFANANGVPTGVNGAPVAGIVSMDPATGAIRQWDASLTQPVNTSCKGRVTDIAVQGTTAYVAAEGDLPGCYEGTYSADIGTGRLNWNAQCLGASTGVAVLGTVLYHGSHQHDCAFTAGDSRGGFVGGLYRDKFIHKYLTAQNTSDGGFVHWTPTTNNVTGPQPVGPHVLETDGLSMFVGGDFTTVNGQRQQGIARFPVSGNKATPKVPGVSVRADPFPNTTVGIASNLAITVQPTRAGTLTVQVPTVEDVDSGTLTYRIFRDGSTTPVSTQTAESYPWSRPVLRFDDTGLAPGSTHSYRVSASDGTFTSALSTAVSGAVAAAAPPALSAAYAALDPQLWWRLGDTGGTAADSSSTGLNTGSYQPGAAPGAPGAVADDSAVTLDGSDGYLTSTGTIAAPNAFSESAWFKTSTIRGGNIVSQTDTQTGAGGNTDRLITMDNNGGLVFAMKAPGTGGPPIPIFGPPSISVRNQGPIWNDGRWHLVTGTYDGNGTAALYVDGALQGTSTGTSFDATAKANGMASGYQRVGYADLTNMQMVFGLNFYKLKWPASEHFDGSIDEVASFDRALTAAQVRSMFAAGVGGGA